jgi:hypothetical protein
MATLIRHPQQKYLDLPDGKVLGIHVVELLSASDDFTVPTLDNSTAGASVSQLRRNGQAAVTVSNSDANTVTVVGGSAGDEVVITTLHQSRRNYIPEA